LLDSFAKKTKHLVVYGQVADNLTHVATSVGVPCTKVSSLDEAIHKALQYAQENAIHYVLFSPAAASFDMFKNVYDRIEQFEKIVVAL
jgi:UDP-N-acetylmuramoylalanine--D-glutamate ligase